MDVRRGATLSPLTREEKGMSILAVGSIAFDTIKTPFGAVTDIVGGSLTYFALAASYFADVNLVCRLLLEKKKNHKPTLARPSCGLLYGLHSHTQAFISGRH